MLGWGAGAPTSAAGASDSALALGEERRRIYSTLAEAAVTGAGMRLPASAAEEVVIDFESVYAGWPVSERRNADAVLDALGRDARMQNRAQRAAVLRGNTRDARDAQLAYRARGLVAVALSSGSDDQMEVSF